MAESVIPDHLKYPTLGSVSSFVFKLEDSKGRVHRFNCGMSHFEWLLLANLLTLTHYLTCMPENSGTESLTELLSTIAQRLGADFDISKLPQQIRVIFHSLDSFACSLNLFK